MTVQEIIAEILRILPRPIPPPFYIARGSMIERSHVNVMAELLGSESQTEHEYTLDERYVDDGMLQTLKVELPTETDEELMMVALRCSRGQGEFSLILPKRILDALMTGIPMASA